MVKNGRAKAEPQLLKSIEVRGYFGHVMRAAKLQKQLVEGKWKERGRSEDRENHGLERCEN